MYHTHLPYEVNSLSSLCFNTNKLIYMYFDSRPGQYGYIYIKFKPIKRHAIDISTLCVKNSPKESKIEADQLKTLCEKNHRVEFFKL
jgi:hypothetical protein